MTLSLLSKISVAHDVQARRFDDELVVLDLARGEYFALDEVGSRIWEGLAAGRGLGAIAVELEVAYAAERPRIEADVLAFVEALLGRSLVVEMV